MPAPTLPKPKPGRAFLYLIGCGGHIKIGVSRNLRQRFTDLQIANPLPLALLGYREEQAEWITDFEQAAHKLLNEHRATGEWFAVTLDTAMAAVDTAHEQIKERKQRERRDEVRALRQEKLVADWQEAETNRRYEAALARLIKGGRKRRPVPAQ